MKEIMKQTEKTEKMRQLTDAELQQVTGGGVSTLSNQMEECEAQGDKANCVKRDYCLWEKGKDGYHCTWVGGPS